MQSNNRTIAKNTIFMYFRMFFTMCVSLYTSRVVLATLGFSDYGLYNVVGGVIAMFGFMNGAMSSTTSRFITYYLGQADKQRLNDVFSMAFFIHFFIAVLIILLGETVGLWFLYNKMSIPEGRITAAFWLFQLSVASTVLMIITVPFTSDIIAREKMSIYAYVSILDALLKLIVVISLAFVTYDRLVFYALALFLIQLLVILFYLFYCRVHFPESKIKKIWNKPLFKEMSSFTGWSLFGNISYIFFSQGINILLNMYCGTIVNAARGIAVQVEGVMMQFTSNVQTAINPQIIKSYSNNNLERMKSLMYASSRYCYFLMFLLSLPVLLGVNYILSLWLGDYPDHTSNFVRILLIIILIEVLINPLYIANLATGKVAIYNKSLAVVSFIFIIVSYFAIKTTKIAEILFLCNLFRVFVGFLVRFIIIRHQLTLSIKDYLRKVAGNILAVTVVSSIAPILFYKVYGIYSFSSFFICMAISFLSVLLTVFLIGLNSKERELLVSRSRFLFNSRISVSRK